MYKGEIVFWFGVDIFHSRQRRLPLFWRESCQIWEFSLKLFFWIIVSFMLVENLVFKNFGYKNTPG